MSTGQEERHRCKTLTFTHERIARPSARWCWRWAPRRRSATGFQLNENSGSGLGNAFAGGAAFTEDASAMWWNPAALSRFPTIQGAAVDAHHHAVDQVQQRRVAAGGQPAARRRRRRRRRLQLRAEHVLVVPINAQWTFGLGINVPFGLDDRVRRRLDRPLPGAEVADRDDQRQSGDLVEDHAAVRASASASTTSRSRRRSRNNVNYSGALLQAAAGAGHHAGSAHVQRHRRRDARARLEGDDRRRRLGVGLEHRPRVGRHAATARSARAIARRSSTTCQGNINFENPTVTLPPGTPPQLAATIALLSAGVNARLVRARRHLRHQAAADRQRLVLYRAQHEVGGHGATCSTPAGRAFPNCEFIATSPPALAGRRRTTGTTRGSSRSARRYKVERPVEVARSASRSTRRRSPTTRRRGCRTPTAGGWRSAPSTSGRRTWKFDAGFAYIFADSPSFNQNAGQHGAQRPRQGHATTRARGSCRCRRRTRSSRQAAPLTPRAATTAGATRPSRFGRRRAAGAALSRAIRPIAFGRICGAAAHPIPPALVRASSRSAQCPPLRSSSARPPCSAPASWARRSPRTSPTPASRRCCSTCPRRRAIPNGLVAQGDRQSREARAGAARGEGSRVAIEAVPLRQRSRAPRRMRPRDRGDRRAPRLEAATCTRRSRRISRRDAVLASNTSGLSLAALSDALPAGAAAALLRRPLLQPAAVHAPGRADRRRRRPMRRCSTRWRRSSPRRSARA